MLTDNFSNDKLTMFSVICLLSPVSFLLPRLTIELLPAPHCLQCECFFFACHASCSWDDDDDADDDEEDDDDDDVDDDDDDDSVMSCSLCRGLPGKSA